MKMTFLGTGTSHGVPVIACSCEVCTSTNPRDKRLRCSALLEHDGQNYLIDVGPDFREQALRHKICRLDAVFITHSHADHLHGIDDLRIFSHKDSEAQKLDHILQHKYPETSGEGLSVYTSERTKGYIHERFPYIFIDHKKGGGIPKLNLIGMDDYNSKNPLILGSENSKIEIIPVPMIHGSHHTIGFVFTRFDENNTRHSLAYLTDCSFISEKSISEIKTAGGQIEHLIIDALREREHSSHCNFLQAMNYAEQIEARHTWFTHMTHDKKHEQIQHYIEENLQSFPNLTRIVQNGGSISPAYDGLIIEA